MGQMTTILIANRGEIALRVIRTARALGYRTVAVHSDADADAPHVDAADIAVRIGPAPAADSYLDPTRLIEAARRSGADAIHPGYGFLSENAGFARACAEAGLLFIGPPPAAIELMGSKRLAKLAMIAAGVPCIPGYQGGDQDDGRLQAEAARIGFALMVKASAGGGGRGLRRVAGAADLPEALRAARSEAQSAFGDGDLILERALDQPRHIEIQIFADDHGNVVHFGERDCSVQRRHQKVIEEAPSPFVSPDLRAAMGAAAVDAARACDYRGAGTVEFLVDAAGGFYFLEMNTRLQVEHPVTELVAGVDLVEWQLKVAAGEALPLTQDRIALSGWAIEARLYAEDPRRDFLPQTGMVLDWAPASGAGVRVDHGLRAGQMVGPHYDPMLAKIIAHGATRSEARRRLACALEDTRLLGVTTNKGFLAAILRHPVFADGHATTGFIDAHMAAETGAGAPGLRQLALAAALIHILAGRRGAGAPDLADWRNSASAPWRYRIESDGIVHDLRLHAERHGTGLRCSVTGDGGQDCIDILRLGEGEGRYVAEGLRRHLHFASDGDWLYVDGPGGSRGFRDLTHAVAAGDDAPGSGRLLAPMDGAVRLVAVARGDRVRRGQTLVVLEAMKMEHRLCADIDGVVERVAVAVGDQARTRAVLVTIAADPPAMARES